MINQKVLPEFRICLIENTVGTNLGAAQFETVLTLVSKV